MTDKRTNSRPSAMVLGEQPWSVPLARAEVPESGRRIVLEADDCSRAAIAKLANLQALPHLQASFDLSPSSGKGLRVNGRIDARVVQTCVVTLEPVENTVAEAVDLVFVPAPDVASEQPSESIELDAADDDDAEPMTNGTIDLGAIATEFFLLGLDPYPRKPGAMFDPPAADEAADGPFAALADLKSRTGGKG